MFGSLGYWASSKGMVTVPDLSGLTEAQASTALSNAVLSYSKVANTQTSNSGLIGKVATQSVAAGQLANYESIIEISIYEFVCVPSWTDWYDIGTPYNFSACLSNNTQTYSIQQRRDDSSCGSASEFRVTTKSIACVYCETQPNYVVREREYYPYSANCQWMYTYDTTYDGCGRYVSRVFLGKGIICD